MFTDKPVIIAGRELNVVVKNRFFVGDEDGVFFDGEPIWLVPETTDMFDLLVALVVFSSKSQARKNWQGAGPEIPPGFSDFEHIGKLHKRLTILNPTRDNLATGETA